MKNLRVFGLETEGCEEKLDGETEQDDEEVKRFEIWKERMENRKRWKIYGKEIEGLWIGKRKMQMKERRWQQRGYKTGLEKEGWKIEKIEKTKDDSTGEKKRWCIEKKKYGN